MEFLISQSKPGNILDLVPEAVYVGVSEYNCPLYTVDIPDLFGLLDFMDRFNHPLVLGLIDDKNFPLHQLEIYNDYRE